MRICMVGTGYVGLVSGVGFAETGADVVCVDNDAEKIAALSRGEITIFEPGLKELLERNLAAKRLSFSDDVEGAIASAEIVFVAVGTPERVDGGADLRAVDRVAEVVAAKASREMVLVIKSTVPVGTNARVRRIVADAPYPIHVVSNPEFLKEGDALNDFLRPDRIVIGADASDDFARQRMDRLYHPVLLQKKRIVWMDPVSAELTKYVSNTMLAMRISFMNEIAALCEKVDADIHAVRRGVGSDTRIGSKFLYAGPGYGGSCFPKDVKALVATAHEHGVEMELPSATDRVNARQKGVLARKLKKHFDGDLRGHRIGVWGLSFKPRTDDIRQSPAIQLIEVALAEGATIVAHDPEARDSARAHFGDRIELVDDAYEAARDASALVLVTEWREYQNPDFERLSEIMSRALLLDGRNIWSSYGLRKMGFVYEGVGVRGS